MSNDGTTLFVYPDHDNLINLGGYAIFEVSVKLNGALQCVDGGVLGKDYDKIYRINNGIDVVPPSVSEAELYFQDSRLLEGDGYFAGNRVNRFTAKVIANDISSGISKLIVNFKRIKNVAGSDCKNELDYTVEKSVPLLIDQDVHIEELIEFPEELEDGLIRTEVFVEDGTGYKTDTGKIWYLIKDTSVPIEPRYLYISNGPENLLGTITLQSLESKCTTYGSSIGADIAKEAMTEYLSEILAGGGTEDFIEGLSTITVKNFKPDVWGKDSDNFDSVQDLKYSMSWSFNDGIRHEFGPVNLSEPVATQDAEIIKNDNDSFAVKLKAGTYNFACESEFILTIEDKIGNKKTIQKILPGTVNVLGEKDGELIISETAGLCYEIKKDSNSSILLNGFRDYFEEVTTSGVNQRLYYASPLFSIPVEYVKGVVTESDDLTFPKYTAEILSAGYNSGYNIFRVVFDENIHDEFDEAGFEFYYRTLDDGVYNERRYNYNQAVDKYSNSAEVAFQLQPLSNRSELVADIFVRKGNVYKKKTEIFYYDDLIDTQAPFLEGIDSNTFYDNAGEMIGVHSGTAVYDLLSGLKSIKMCLIPATQHFDVEMFETSPTKVITFTEKTYSYANLTHDIKHFDDGEYNLFVRVYDNCDNFSDQTTYGIKISRIYEKASAIIDPDGSSRPAHIVSFKPESYVEGRKYYITTYGFMSKTDEWGQGYPILHGYPPSPMVYDPETGIYSTRVGLTYKPGSTAPFVKIAVFSDDGKDFSSSDLTTRVNFQESYLNAKTSVPHFYEPVIMYNGERICTVKMFAMGEGFASLFTDQPVYVETRYSDTNYGEQSGAWMLRGYATNCQILNKDLDGSNAKGKTYTIDTSEIKKGQYYIITAHFADGTKVYSPVYKK